jgi:hypothetical protein
LTDPGTGTYFGCRQTRDAFRRTAAHNTLTVDQLDQADIYDTFKWVNPMNVKLLEAAIDEDLGFAVAVHDGYFRLRKPVMHYRTVLSLRPVGWIIVDYLEGKGRHSVIRHFHFPPVIDLQRENPSCVTAIDPTSGDGLRFHFPYANLSGASGPQFDGQGTWSARYGRWRSAPEMKLETVACMPLFLFTAITPLYGRSEVRPAHDALSFSTTPLADGQAALYRRVSSHHGNSVEELILVNPKCHSLTLPGDLSCDGSFLFLQRFFNGPIDRAFLVGEGRWLTGLNFRLRCEQSSHYARYVRSDSPVL